MTVVLLCYKTIIVSIIFLNSLSTNRIKSISQSVKLYAHTHTHARTHTVVSTGMFYVLLHFVRSLHVAAFL